jgi:hypothetical protein
VRCRACCASLTLPPRRGFRPCPAAGGLRLCAGTRAGRRRLGAPLPLHFFVAPHPKLATHARRAPRTHPALQPPPPRHPRRPRRPTTTPRWHAPRLNRDTPTYTSHTHMRQLTG